MKLSNDAQAVIVKKENDTGYSFLVIKRFDKEKQADHYRLVKGGVDGGETAEEAVVREIGEEVGIKEVTKTEFLCHYGYTGGEVRHEVDVFLAFVGNTDKEINVDSTNEGGFTIKNAVWMKGDEAANKLTFGDEKKLITQAVNKLSI